MTRRHARVTTVGTWRRTRLRARSTVALHMNRSLHSLVIDSVKVHRRPTRHKICYFRDALSSRDILAASIEETKLSIKTKYTNKPRLTQITQKPRLKNKNLKLHNHMPWSLFCLTSNFRACCFVLVGQK